MFSILQVEDLDVPAVDITSVPQDKPSAREMRNWHDDFAVFDHLRTIQAEVCKTWEECKSGNIDQVTASAITSAAIDLVRHIEEGLRRTISANIGKGLDGIAYCLIYAEAARKREGVDWSRMSTEIAKFKERAYVTVFIDLHIIADYKSILDRFRDETSYFQCSLPDINFVARLHARTDEHISLGYPH